MTLICKIRYWLVDPQPTSRAKRGSCENRFEILFSFETCRSVNRIFPPASNLEGSQGRCRRRRRGRVNCENRGAPPFLSLQCNVPPSSVFSKLIYAPDSRRGHCARPACVVVHSNKLTTGGPAARIVAPLNNPRGEKGRKMAMRLGQMPGEKVANLDCPLSYDGSPRARESLTRFLAISFVRPIVFSFRRRGGIRNCFEVLRSSALYRMIDMILKIEIESGRGAIAFIRF